MTKRRRPSVQGKGTRDYALSAPTPPPEGEWSLPMSLTEMATRLGLPVQKFKVFAEMHGLLRLTRKLWLVRLDRMDAATRCRIETGRRPPSPSA